MTAAGPGDANPDPARPGRAADAERVLGEALRAMAGGGKRGASGDAAPGADRGWLSRLTTAQLLLLAVIVGLAVGMIAGLVTLVW